MEAKAKQALYEMVALAGLLYRNFGQKKALKEGELFYAHGVKALLHLLWTVDVLAIAGKSAMEDCIRREYILVPQRPWRLKPVAAPLATIETITTGYIEYVQGKPLT